MTTNSDDDIFTWLQEREHTDHTTAVMTIAARRLHDDGWSYRDIGVALGVSYEWVRRRMAHPSAERIGVTQWMTATPLWENGGDPETGL